MGNRENPPGADRIMRPAICCDCAATFPAPATSCPHCYGARFVAHPELSRLTTAHIDCDAFYASVEKRDRPELAEKPVIIGGTSGRGVVTTACYVARQYGPRSAMPMFKALELCPDAIVIKPDMAKYSAVSQQIREIFYAATPVIEPVALDEAYLDLSDEHRTQEDTAAEALAHIALAIEEELRITVSIGLSHNKFLAKLASDLNKPRGFSIIGKAETYAFLSELPVSKINGVGAATEQRMHQFGIRTIGDLQQMDERLLKGRFGKFGSRLAAYAKGEDPRTVKASRKTKSVSNETTFRNDIAHYPELRDIAERLAEKVAGRLQTKGIAGQTAVLKLKTANFQILTRNHRLANPTQRADRLIEAILPLLKRETDGRAFRLLGVGISDLTPAEDADPPDLFDPPPPGSHRSNHST